MKGISLLPDQTGIGIRHGSILIVDKAYRPNRKNIKNKNKEDC